MNNFTRTGDSKKALNVGNVAKYSEMWKKEMSDLYDYITKWSAEMGIEYTWSILDKTTGRYQWIKLDSLEQETEMVLDMGLETLISLLNKWRIKEDQNEASHAMDAMAMNKAYSKY
jgi:hypothetical protein